MPPDTATKSPPARKPPVDWVGFLLRAAAPILAILAALLVGAIMLLLLGANPLTAYATMVKGVFGSTYGFTQSLVKATPLLLVGLGICIAFRASVLNIGGEGQIIAGALMTTWFSLQFRTWPGWILLPATLIMGFLAGAFWGFIPGILKARLNVNEILSTVMMNAIGLQLMNLLLRGPLIDPAGVAAGTFLHQSERLPEQVWLGRLQQTQLHTGAIIAVVLAVLVYIFLWRTTIGYRIRAVGLSPEASKYAGIPVPFYQALSLTLAGGFAGLAGVIEIIGVQHRLLEGVTSGYGFSGIVAALFGGLLVGADMMQRAVQVPSALIDALLGLIVLLVIGSQMWSRRLSTNRTIALAKKAELAATHQVAPGAEAKA